MDILKVSVGLQWVLMSKMDFRCGTKRLWKIILMSKDYIYILIHVKCRKELFAAALNCNWNNSADSAVNGIRYCETATTQEGRVSFNIKIFENIK